MNDGSDLRQWLQPGQKSAREPPHMQRLHSAAQRRAEEEHKSGSSLDLLNFLTENLGAIGASTQPGRPAANAKAAGGRTSYRPRSALEAQRLDTESTTLNLMTRSVSASFKSFSATAAGSLALSPT